jgi:hypothetical protein
MQDPIKIFGNDPLNMRHALGKMVQQAHIDANCDRDAANQRVRNWLDLDRRFDTYDKDRLVARVEECGLDQCEFLKRPYLGRPGNDLNVQSWKWCNERRKAEREKRKRNSLTV